MDTYFYNDSVDHCVSILIFYSGQTHLNNGYETDAGHVRMYKNKELSIEELQEIGIVICPNPTKGLVQIECPNHQIRSLGLTDILGKKILTKTNS